MQKSLKLLDKIKINPSLVCILIVLWCFLLAYLCTILFDQNKLDLSEGQLYSLSEHTISLVKKTKEPIRLKLFYSQDSTNKGSDQLRHYQNYFVYIVDIINLFSYYSNGLISLEIIDPTKNTDFLQQTLEVKLKAYSITDNQNFYLGLVAENSYGDRQVIDFLPINAKHSLEYNLAKLIYLSSNPEKLKIAVISIIDLVKRPPTALEKQLFQSEGMIIPRSWHSFAKLNELYDLEQIADPNTNLDNYHGIIVVHPHGIPSALIKEIDRYIYSGGKALIFTDPHLLVDLKKANIKQLSNSPDQEFAELLNKWGIHTFPNTFAGDLSLSKTADENQGHIPFKIIPIVNCNEQCTKPFDQPATRSISSLTMAFPGPIEVADPHSTKLKLQYQPVLSTTSQGNYYSTTNHIDVFNPRSIADIFIPGNHKVIIGIKITGEFPRAFDQQDQTPDKDPPNHQTNKHAKIIIYNDVDILSDSFAFDFAGSPSGNQNIELLISSVDALVGNQDLLSIRAKNKKTRDLYKLKEITTKALEVESEQIFIIEAQINQLTSKLNQLNKQLQFNKEDQYSEQDLITTKFEINQNINQLTDKLRIHRAKVNHYKLSVQKTIKHINTLLIPLLIIIFAATILVRRYIVTRKKSLIN